MASHDVCFFASTDPENRIAIAIGSSLHSSRVKEDALNVKEAMQPYVTITISIDTEDRLEDSPLVLFGSLAT